MSRHKLILRARELRRDQTEAEKVLWTILRSRQMEGFKFRRQEPIGSYIADFVNYERKIVIELDGGQHAMNEGQKRDQKRDQWFRDQGFRVLRFWDHEVLQNSDSVLETIRQAMLTPSPYPSRRGRGSLLKPKG